MIEPNWDSATEEELWKYVGYSLKKNEIDTTLVGGAVVAIYSSGVYRSGDLDLVNMNNREEKIINETLQELGFEKRGRHFEHQKCKHIFIEFVPSPLSIGSDHTVKPYEVLVEGIIIKILSPTDCIKDRLASYIYFDARECLDQAVLVATKQKFDLHDVKDWCANEGDKAKQAYVDFIRILKKSG
ncbi:MAG: hypothetical protein JXQ30_09510 [Spirochaetes bacterium]|nr:hypothetical protein [Spirochaetota bacterium]